MADVSRRSWKLASEANSENVAWQLNNFNEYAIMTQQRKSTKKSTKAKAKSATTAVDESSTSATKSPVTSEDESDNEDFITISKLDEVLQKHLQPIHKLINDTITKLQTDLDAVRQIAENALKLEEQNKKSI